MRAIHLYLLAIAGTAVLASDATPTAEPRHALEGGPAIIVTATAPEPEPHRMATAHSSDADYPVQEAETIRRTFDLAGAAQKSLDVDNVWGSIEVAGTDGNQIQLVITKTIRASTQQKLADAKREVTLDVSEQPGQLKLYVNGPFRCECNCGDGCKGNCGRSFRWRDHEGYMVKMDFMIQVPRAIDIELRTVNSGEVRVRDVKGRYLVRNVNGGIEMQRVAGSGTAHTVNGPVRVSFTENPREGSSFKSVNGDIELRFAAGLSADFRFKTFNGGIYSDYAVTALPPRSIEQVNQGGKRIYRADRFTSARVGSGGAEITLENLNGDIRILEKP